MNMKMTRTSRESEARDNHLRIEYDMDYISPLTLPPGVAKEGFAYRWEVTDIRGRNNFQVEKRLRQGWALVPAARAPAYALDPLKRNPLTADWLCVNDLILMEMPETLYQRGIERQNYMNANKIASLRQDPTMVIRDIRPSTINSF